MSNLTAPRGTYDILPAQSVRWQALEGIIDAACARFGYGEIRTPTFEDTSVFLLGVGATTDIVEKEMYTFLDKGGDSMTLRLLDVYSCAGGAGFGYHLAGFDPRRSGELDQEYWATPSPWCSAATVVMRTLPLLWAR